MKKVDCCSWCEYYIKCENLKEKTRSGYICKNYTKYKNKIKKIIKSWTYYSEWFVVILHYDGTKKRIDRENFYEIDDREDLYNELTSTIDKLKREIDKKRFFEISFSCSGKSFNRYYDDDLADSCFNDAYGDWF